MRHAGPLDPKEPVDIKLRRFIIPVNAAIAQLVEY